MGPPHLVAMSIAALARPRTWVPSIDIAIPVFNEERDLAPAVRRLYAHLHGGDFPFSARITIADNASTDGTAAQALRLSPSSLTSGWCGSTEKEKGVRWLLRG
jgi:hypothetical protein